MSGGADAKQGQWYEHEYVVSLWLGLISGEIDRVAWEFANGISREDGVDVRFVEAGRRVAAQCKKHDRKGSGAWRLVELRGVLCNAARDLVREDIGGADEFRFVTMTQVNDQLLDTRFLGHPLSGDEISRRRERLNELLSGKSITSAGLDALAQRFEVEVVGWPRLRRVNEQHARLLTRSKPQQLLDKLRSKQSEAIGIEWARADLIGSLPDSVRNDLVGPFGDELVGARRQSTAYVNSANVRRITVGPATTPQSAFARPEVDRVLAELRRANPPATMRVHGPSGVGKTHVLAAITEALVASGGPVLALSASDVRTRALDGDLLERLVVRSRYGERLVVVLDQLDSLLDAVADRKRLIDDVVELAHVIGDANCTLIIGCRTVDARVNTDLDAVFYAARRGAEIFDQTIGDLEESAVVCVLEDLGIAASQVDTASRHLLRRPLALRLFKRLAPSLGENVTFNSLADIVERFLDEVFNANDEARAAFGEFLVHFRQSELAGVPRHLIEASPAALDALIRYGVLVQADSSDPLHPFHSAITDFALAREIGRGGSAADVLDSLGARNDQTLSCARRLRLAIPMIAGRPGLGPKLLSDLVGSNELRWHMKRALFMGLADMGSPPDSGLVSVVRSWLDEDDLRRTVMDVLLRGSTHWVDPLEDWLMTAWPTLGEKDHEALLSVLATVSIARGDLVARVLAAWAKVDDRVLQLAERVLPYDPSDDSRLLFELRRSLPERLRYPDSSPRWKRFFASAPDRAAIWLGDLMEALDADALIGRKWGRRVPGRNALEDCDIDSCAHEIWLRLRDVWFALNVPDLESVRVPSGSSKGSPISSLVELLAEVWAARIRVAGTSWNDVVRELIDDKARPIDRWLALNIARALDTSSVADLELAARWLMTDRVARGLRIDLGARGVDSFPAAGLAASLIDLPIDLDVRAEVARWGADGQPSPFDWLELEDLSAVESRIQASRDNAARLRETWGQFEWLGALTEAEPAAMAPGLRRRDLVNHLAHLVRTESADWVEFLIAASSHEPPLADEVLTDIALALIRPSPNSGASRDSSSVSDQVAVELVADHGVFRGAYGVRALATVVRDRATAAWPGAVIERLLLGVKRTSQPMPSMSFVAESVGQKYRDRRTLLMAVYNELAPSCALALESVAAAGTVETSKFSDSWLVAARTLSESSDSAERVAGVVLGNALSEEHRTALALTAASDPVAAVEPMVARPLFAILDGGGSDGELAETRLRDAVTACGDGFVQEVASVVVGLVARSFHSAKDAVSTMGRIEGGKLALVEAIHSSARSVSFESWQRDLILYLLDMPEDFEGEKATAMLTQGAARGLFDDKELALAVVESEGARRSPNVVVEVFDRWGQLFCARQLVTESSRKLVERADQHGSRQAWERRHEVGVMLGALRRLSDACERNGNFDERGRALDQLDELLRAYPDSWTAFSRPLG